MVDDGTKGVKQRTIIYEVPKITLGGTEGGRERKRERERKRTLWIIQRAHRQTLLYLADYFVVVGHTIVDQCEGIVARATGVGSDQEPPITFRSLLEQSNSSLHNIV